MTIEKGLIGKEDIQFGTGTYERKGKSGQNITLDKVNARALPIVDAGSKFDSSNVDEALQECQTQNGIGSVAKDYTNKSGAQRVLGDVVLIDSDNDESFETTTSANSLLVLGVVSETIEVNASGQVIAGGYINQIKVTGATARGSFLQTSTTEGEAQSSTTFDTGTFAIALSSTAGAGTVSALVFGSVSGAYLPTAGGIMTGEFLSAGRKLGYLSKNADYTLETEDEFIDVTAGVSGVTITIASADIIKSGKRWIIRNADGGAGNVTIATEESETINGSDSKTLSSQYELAVFYSDGTNIIEDSISLINSTLTNPTITGGLTLNADSWPSFRAGRSANQSVNATTWTKAQMDVEDFDTNSDFEHTTDFRFTPTVAGKYLLVARTGFGFGTTSAMQTAIYKNGTVIAQGGAQQTNSTVITSDVTTLQEANGSTDYFEVFVWISAGPANMRGRTTDKGSEFSGSRIA